MNQNKIKSHLAQYEKLADAYKKMLPEERAQLAIWEKENLGEGGLATSDWPGWDKVFSRLAH